MIMSIDIETYEKDEKGQLIPILDATKFILGCTIIEGQQPKIWNKPQDMWNYIIEKGKAQQKRNKTLKVYAHNTAYDFYGIANLNDQNLKHFCQRPFITNYIHNKRECITFLDTLSIYKMNLKKVGHLIGLEKMDLPETETANLQKLEPYLIRDTQIVLKAYQYIKQKLEKDGIKLQRIYTINQIAIQYLLNELKKESKEWKETFFWYEQKNETRRTLRAEEIHSAYRGGRVEAFQTGHIKKVEYIDCNSLYPYSATQMEFPDLRTERKHIQPLQNKTTTQAIQPIGIYRCLIKNQTNEIGLLPIRTPNGNYYPKESKYLIGTWTDIELKEAIKEGYKIINIEWAVTYDKTKNPFKKIMPKIYNKRKNSKNEFDNYFYKMMMNAGIGKLAQTKTNQEIIIDSVEKAHEYLSKNYEIIKGLKYKYMYRKDKPTIQKPYYTPIIPTRINAYARIYMYQQFKKVDKNKLVYTDTDSIILEGEIPNTIPRGTELGQFKIEASQQPIIIYGKKTYCIGDEAKISGFKNTDITPQQFEQGYISSKKMLTINTTNDIKKVGTFITEHRNLKEQLQNHKECNTLMEEQEIYVDQEIDNITYFQKDLEKIAENTETFK